MEGWEQLANLETCWRYRQGIQGRDGGKTWGPATEFRAHVERKKMTQTPDGPTELPGYGYKVITNEPYTRLGDLIVISQTAPPEQDIAAGRGDAFEVREVKEITNASGATFFFISG